VYRKGQQRDVEIVKIVAEGTIDDEKMLLLQKEKTENISTVISHPVLHSRAGVEDILGTFGKVTHVEGGGLRVDIDDSEE
jgi:SNF2 family DNA or RNA helicase